MNKDEEEENEKSIYNYNMIFNRINNYDEDIKFNTNLISDIDLQNFDPERYEYYTNLLYIYNKDPKTLYDLLNKYYNVKSMHEKEKGIIKYIYDYARKLKDAEDDTATPPASVQPEGGAGGGGSMRRRNKRRRNRQAGGVGEEKTWQNTFINIIKDKMPKKVEKKKEPTPDASADEEDDDVEYYIEKEGVSDLSKKIKLLEEKIGEIKKMKKDSLGSTFYKDLKSRLNKKKEKGKDDENEEKTPESSVSSSATKSSLVASAEPSASAAAPSSVASAANDTSATEEIPLGSVVDELVNIVNVLTAQVGTQSAAPVAAPVAASAEPSSSAAASLEVLNTLTDLANTLQVKIENSTSEEKKISKKQEADLASTISSLQYLTSALIGGGMKGGGAGNSDEQLKMKYLDNNKYKGIDTWKKIKELKSNLKTQPENIDENNKIARLSQDIDNYNFSGKTKEDDKYIIQQLNNFENDPNNPLDELAITFDDRLVFIIATFFIRYITIIIVQWCIDINIIKTFYEGFIYYAIIYIIIFWFVVLFINIDNGYDVKYMNFNGIINSIRTLFYYFYMGTNGISRLLVHTSLIIILIIIPIILNIKRKADYVDDEQTETEKILDNEERKQLSKSLSLFTMFIWLFTSIIATKF
jgi:hypothetical protein